MRILTCAVAAMLAHGTDDVALATTRARADADRATWHALEKRYGQENLTSGKMVD
ncbi:MAG: hypothetical protein QGH33_18670 [Pirellulaceae bacterium]|nr:hypothetical protein [Pirellulaceae bacterium]